MFFDPSTKERGSLDPSCRVTAVGSGGAVHVGQVKAYLCLWTACQERWG